MSDKLRIAFITPEATPLAAGGIGTFIANITKGLKQLGVYCEVFYAVAENQRHSTEVVNGIIYHPIPCRTIGDLAQNVVPVFIERDKEIKFSIVEGTELHAPLRILMEKYPNDFKYVVRTHMPVVQQIRLNNHYQSFWKKMRYVVGALRRFRLDWGYWNTTDVKRKKDVEFLTCEKADLIITPSNDFKKWLVDFWKLPPEKITVIFHPFDADSLLPCTENETNPDKSRLRILFTGKLNAHKGVVNLAFAAKKLLKKYPHIEFVLVGENWGICYGNKKVSASDLLRKIVGPTDRFILKGKVPYSQLTCYFASAGICIFPSLWEAWGYTCTEAMAYGRAVIGSSNGGMADMISDGENGLLVNPFSVKDIIQKLELLISREDMREKLGKNAELSIREELNVRKIALENMRVYNLLVA